ncbi:hypothetical protein RSOLAG22IIIB_12623 [Rhizoctonia solani]|uniref:Uncharacterized protein n=1 Tax=Rhizoctonia solani TaxID=456999 RepID=A0A0K6GF15_9AGAM|nr:hypothetical protein RSOLAG22IIIB_12623 [Rhizoctonia solani]
MPYDVSALQRLRGANDLRPPLQEGREARRERRQRESESPEPENGEGEQRLDKRPRLIVLSAKKGTTDEYGVAARQITRLVDMCWEPRSAINAGIALLVLDDDAARVELATASTEKKLLYTIFFTLCDLLPGLRDSVDWDDIRSRLDNGKTAAKTEDNRTFKTQIPKWHTWDPLLSLNKNERGLQHMECARLLCPITVDWDDLEARRRFLIENVPPQTAEEWPACLYDGKPDPNDLFKGLMRSTLFVNAVRGVVLPPSVVDAFNSKHAPDHRSNRRTKADTYKIQTVTPGLLAYVAVLLRYSLSSETIFVDHGGSFSYVHFYNDIAGYLNDPQCKDQTKELME